MPLDDWPWRKAPKDDLERWLGKWCLVGAVGDVKIEGVLSELTEHSFMLFPTVLLWAPLGAQPPRYAIGDEVFMAPRASVQWVRGRCREDAERWIVSENDRMRRTHEREAGNYR